MSAAAMTPEKALALDWYVYERLNTVASRVYRREQRIREMVERLGFDGTVKALGIPPQTLNVICGFGYDDDEDEGTDEVVA